MEYKQIATYDNYLLANMTLGMLQENEIDCHLKDEYIVTVDPLLNPAVGGIKLMVAVPDYPAAGVLITEAENEYLKEIPCPACKSCSLVVEEKTDKPAGFWGRMKNLVAYGQEELHQKYYRCQHCGRKVDEIPSSL